MSIEYLDDDGRRALKRELQIVRACKHDFIVSFREAICSGGELWIVMELMVRD